MVNIFLGRIFDTKIINHKSESDAVGFVFPKARCEAAWIITMRFQDLFEFVVSEFACLWQTIHTFLDSKIYSVVVDFIPKVVFIHEIVWDEFKWNVHVFTIFHFGHEIHIFDVDTHVFGCWI